MTNQTEIGQEDAFEQELFGLITRYEDDALDDGGLNRLNELLAGFSVARELFNDFCLQSLSIGEALAVDAVPVHEISHAPRSRKVIAFPRWAYAVAAAVAVLFATAYNFFQDDPVLEGVKDGLVWKSEPLAVLVHSQTGTVDFLKADGTPITGDQANVLSPGNVVVIHGPDSSTVLDYPDGSRIKLGPGSRASFVDADRKLVNLERGELLAYVQPQSADKPFGVLTPHAEITVVGTQFLVAVGEDDTKVEVSEGRVQVNRLSDQSATEVVAGHELVVASDGELAVAALPPVDGTTVVVPDGSSVANAPQGPPLKIGLNIGKGGTISGTAGNQPATLRGRVLDATGQPWPNAQVSIYDNENARDAVAEATTDADGRFEIKARVDGEVFVRVGTVIEAKDIAKPGKETNLGDLSPDAK